MRCKDCNDVVVSVFDVEMALSYALNDVEHLYDDLSCIVEQISRYVRTVDLLGNPIVYGIVKSVLNSFFDDYVFLQNRKQLMEYFSSLDSSDVDLSVGKTINEIAYYYFEEYVNGIKNKFMTVFMDSIEKRMVK